MREASSTKPNSYIIDAKDINGTSRYSNGVFVNATFKQSNALRLFDRTRQYKLDNVAKSHCGPTFYKTIQIKLVSGLFTPTFIA